MDFLPPLAGCRLRLTLVLGLLAVAGTTAAAQPPTLTAGTHAIIPGFERFLAADANKVAGGQLLLGELNCTSCHAVDETRKAALAPKQAPILDTVGTRVQKSFLRHFLENPQKAKPGTAMPNVLAHLPEPQRKESIEALTHLLASTGSLGQEPLNRQLADKGRTAYHQLGCVACHGTRNGSGEEEKVLPTSVRLGELERKYSIPSLSVFLTQPHLVRPSGRMPGLLKPDEAQQVAHYLLQNLPSPPPNLHYTYYEGNWDKLPKFEALKPRASGAVHGFHVGVARRSNNMALKFDGYLRIDRDGEYTFHLTSDDGSQLWLDGKSVVNNDGIHAPSTRSGKTHLTKGMHKLTAAVFNAGGGVELGVEIEGAGLPRQSAESRIFKTEAGPVPVVKKGDEDFTIDPTLVAKGQQVFAAVGCASCHQLKLDGKAIVSTLKAPELTKLHSNNGCLAPSGQKNSPRFGLSQPQRTALAAALETGLDRLAKVVAPAEVVTRTFIRWNCYACHERYGHGGPEEGLKAYFSTTQPEMGDEGRLPPSLNGVGAKIRPDYLKEIFTAGSDDRPYMHTRMPRYGLDNIGHLLPALTQVDTLPAVKEVAFQESQKDIKRVGRHIVGAKALGCIKCHTFNGQKAEGVQGIDMTLMPKRLNRDWFFPYLINPSKFRPGTRMPTAWPDGMTALTNVLGGSTDKQIEAIWVYLSDGKKAVTPVGMGPHFIELIPEEEAIIYRNFIAGAGPRAIGVGFPEHVNLAFDAENQRLALLWQGAFIDAGRHWNDRGVGYQAPLGDAILHLPDGPAFVQLSKDDQPWPTQPSKQLGYKFRGYRLTPDRRPTFRYSYKDIQIEDFPNAVREKTQPALHRTLSLTAAQPVDNLYFRAAVGKIEASGDGWYRINDQYRLRIESAAPPQIRNVGGQQELLVPVRFSNNRAEIVQDYVW